jgi:hypothetical protein
MTNEQKEAIAILKKEQAYYVEAVKNHNELQYKIDSIIRQCKHESHLTVVESDDYEGRRFYHHTCYDCGFDWYGDKNR